MIVIKRKIIFYLVNFNRGGAEWVVTNLINSMLHNEIDVTLVTVKKGEMLDEIDKNVKTRQCNGSFLISFLHLLRLLRKNKGCVLFTTQRGASVFGFLINKLSFSGNRHVIREAASNFESFFRKKSFIMKRVWRFLYRLSYRSADRIIVNSAGTRIGLEVADIIRKNCRNVFQIDNPLDIQLIRARAELDDLHGIPFDQTTIVSISRLVPQKNIDVLLKAFHLVEKSRPLSRLIIIGDGPEKANLVRLSSDLGIDKKVFFTGRIPNPYPILKNADILVLVSQWEGFGQVITEALALGVPVVTTKNLDGPVHILNNGQYGELVEENSVDDLAVGIMRSLNSTHDREKLRRRAEMFDKEIISRLYEDTIFA